MNTLIRCLFAALCIVIPATLAQAEPIDVSVVQVDPTHVLPNHVTNDIVLDFDSRLLAQAMLLTLTQGSIYQSPIGGMTAPTAGAIALSPELEFDTFLTIGGRVSEESESLMTPGGAVDLDGMPGIAFDTHRLDVTWTATPGIRIPTGDDFATARITLSDDAQGTLKYLGTASGAPWWQGEFNISNGVISGPLLPPVTPPVVGPTPPGDDPQPNPGPLPPPEIIITPDPEPTPPETIVTDPPPPSIEPNPEVREPMIIDGRFVTGDIIRVLPKIGSIREAVFLPTPPAGLVGIELTESGEFVYVYAGDDVDMDGVVGEIVFTSRVPFFTSVDLDDIATDYTVAEEFKLPPVFGDVTMVTGIRSLGTAVDSSLARFIGTSRLAAHSLSAMAQTQVPEPASVAIAALGFLALTAGVRRRRSL